MAFNRNNFVSLLTDFYAFCSRLHWDPDGVERPPEGGWPQITEQTVENLKKDNAAFDLIRHMPYPKIGADPSKVPLIMVDTWPVAYHRREVQEWIKTCDHWYRIEPFGERLPPSCVSIALGSCDGYFVVLDTKDGLVYWGEGSREGHDEPPTPLNKDVSPQDDDHWRGIATNVYKPEDFFALCKQRFREMSWIGVESLRVESSRNRDWDKEHTHLAGALSRAGWPGDGEGHNWDRSAFEAEVRECLEKGGDDSR